MKCSAFALAALLAAAPFVSPLAVRAQDGPELPGLEEVRHTPPRYNPPPRSTRPATRDVEENRTLRRDTRDQRDEKAEQRQEQRNLNRDRRETSRDTQNLQRDTQNLQRDARQLAQERADILRRSQDPRLQQRNLPNGTDANRDPRQPYGDQRGAVQQNQRNLSQERRTAQGGNYQGYNGQGNAPKANNGQYRPQGNPQRPPQPGQSGQRKPAPNQQPRTGWQQGNSRGR